MPRYRETELRTMLRCFLCRGAFQFGPHLYEGRRINAWGGIMVCEQCEDSNWDGIVRGHFPHLEEHLRSKGIPLPINQKGHIGIPPKFT